MQVLQMMLNVHFAASHSSSHACPPVKLIAQVVNHDERRNVRFGSREFHMFVPRCLIIVYWASGYVQTVLYPLYCTYVVSFCKKLGFLELETVW
jgi:hypothetical protein